MTFLGAIEGGAEAGGEGGGIIGAFFGPEGIPIGGAIGAVGGGLAAGAGYLWLSSHMSNANDQSKAKSDAGSTTDSCSTCKPRDPCQGLRDQIAKHQQKLANFTANPYAYDNKGFLGQGRDNQVISTRIANLKRQIAGFQKQLDECEKKNAKS